VEVFGAISNGQCVCVSVTQQELPTYMGNGFILQFVNGGKVSVIRSEERSLRLLLEILGTVKQVKRAVDSCTIMSFPKYYY
jgi:hypothetical protein